ncbi:MAG: 2Fe-2S iron-sulfur cluster-binding protein [Desulfobacterales bacterium]|jgi:succinate dehydrogenase / fumarate reductase iron-sulfur subunit
MKKQTKHQLTLKIRRFDPENMRAGYQTYHLEAGGVQRFVDLFRMINDTQDPTLAWNSSCEHGQCGTCSVRINGLPVLACELLVENAVQDFKTTSFTIDPLEVVLVVRDLAIDIEKVYENLDRIKPYIIEPITAGEKQPHQIAPELLEQYVEATRCINCFCCASACISSHRRFLGPNAMLSTIVRLMDPREKSKQERLEVLYSDEGVLRCHSSHACSKVCPKEIDVAHFIAMAKSGAVHKSAATARVGGMRMAQGRCRDHSAGGR